MCSSKSSIVLLLKANRALARTVWGALSSLATRRLSELTRQFSFSVASGDLALIDGKWYVTHSGLLHLAARKRCGGISARPLPSLCNVGLRRWIFKATVYKHHASRPFTGFGDADPSNVSSLVHGAECRVAETRAVNRALRKAYGIGICSVEEIGCVERSVTHERPVRNLHSESSNRNNGGGANGNGTRVRDRLCQIIRQHKLDAELVKSYAIDFCETTTLREASRERVEKFVAHLAECAAKDRNSLLCQLNSYAPQKEGAA